MADRNSTGIVGRPTKINEETVLKLESIFKIGGTVEEACSYALINKTTYYRRFKEDEDFATKMESAQHYSDIAAKNVVNVSILKEKNIDSAKWWLDKREYNLRELERRHAQQNVTNNTINIIGDDVMEKYLYEFYKRLTPPKDTGTDKEDANGGEGTLITEDNSGGHTEV